MFGIMFSRIGAFFYRFASAVGVAKRYFTRHITKCEAWDWSQNDHRHICLPLRVCDEDTFNKVCPCRNEKRSEAECYDFCDHCRYLVIMDFNSDSTGEYIETIGHKSFLKTY